MKKYVSPKAYITGADELADVIRTSGIEGDDDEIGGGSSGGDVETPPTSSGLYNF
ncbi:MAG: hypothetical protein IKB38_07210 [Clostridia bacterium]|nr:hypothetical protein [Clostridia bacterium]